ncbi:polyubiquitin 11-like [Impatiens glandulifera]|uniref:polyubiquitin 11-like n=1 Tax=Impatiens glandulifera TaxID=253017 RepID=UPI001FB05826|nr:polyubiquitin 11-like [Impatiens glandulifera]
MQVFIKSVAGKTIKLVVDSSDSIDFATVKIEDTTITVDVQKEPTDQFEIILKTPNGPIFTFNNVGSSDTIHSFKVKIEEKIKIYAVDEQRLIFEGKQLCDDSHTLNDYHIHNKSTIYLIPRVGGGTSKRKR